MFHTGWGEREPLLLLGNEGTNVAPVDRNDTHQPSQGGTIWAQTTALSALTHPSLFLSSHCLSNLPSLALLWPFFLFPAPGLPPALSTPQPLFPPHADFPGTQLGAPLAMCEEGDDCQVLSQCRGTVACTHYQVPTGKYEPCVFLNKSPFAQEAWCSTGLA